MSSSISPAETTTLAARRGGRGLRAIALAAVVVPLVALTACGGSSSGSSSGSSASGSSTASSAADAATGFPVTVTAGNGPVTIAKAPKAIVSMAPSLTETLFAIGAGGQVKAVDSLSDYPAEAPRTKLSAFQPNAEAIVGYQPDLVVLSNDSNGVVAALSKLKVPVLLLPAPKTLDESFEQERLLGAVTGHPRQAILVADQTRETIDKAVASVPASAKGLKIYHEVDPTYYSVTSSTFLGSVYARFGLKNIADAAPKAAASGGYPQLSAEYVVSAMPDVIVLADGKCCQQSPEAVAKRPAFASVPAVKQGKVVAIDDDISSRWGPRVAELAQQLANVLSGRPLTASASASAPASTPAMTATYTSTAGN